MKAKQKKSKLKETYKVNLTVIQDYTHAQQKEILQMCKIKTQ